MMNNSQMWEHAQLVIPMKPALLRQLGVNGF